jgi:Late exocytosis, associated with Golgi transport
MKPSQTFWELYKDEALMRSSSYFDMNPPAAPPGSPPTIKYSGPWLETQLAISFTIGLVSFLTFSYCRTRWPVLFAPRTKLKGQCQGYNWHIVCANVRIL